jgi:prepilin-type N-terminal cleavage/methylation domain-containing protein
MRQSDSHTRARRALGDHAGFSLIEVLVVVIIISILAVIVLPLFVGQTHKGQDAAAKSDARNVSGAVEACRAAKTDYTDCDSEAKLGSDGDHTGVTFGGGPGQVELAGFVASSYRVIAHARSGNSFTIARDASGDVSRTCDTASSGGCPAGGSW